MLWVYVVCISSRVLLNVVLCTMYSHVFCSNAGRKHSLFIALKEVGMDEKMGCVAVVGATTEYRAIF